MMIRAQWRRRSEVLEERGNSLTLSRYLLDLANNVGRDELLEVEHTDVVEETELEVLQLERGEVEAAEHAELVDLQEGVQRLQLEQALDVKDILLEEGLELQDVEVVDVGQVAEELELQRVDVEQVVEVDLAELVEPVELVDVELEPAGLDVGGGSGRGGRGGGDQGGQGRDEESSRLHFAGCGDDFSKQVIKGLEFKSTAVDVLVACFV